MISVIIPNYNHCIYLEQRIESVLNQTFTDFELIILDDKSTDNSKEIIEKYRFHPRITHIIYNDINSGTTFKQWNKGVSLANGKYIWIAESDDYANPILLEKLYNKLTQQEDITLAFCQSYRVDSEGLITGDWNDYTEELDKDRNLFRNDFTIDGNSFIKNYLIHKNVIPNASGVLFRKDKYLEIGEANTKIGYIGDWLVWLRLASIGKISFCSEKLNYFRSHENSFMIRSWSKNNNLFFKKYHINLRLAYNQFLSKKKEYKELKCLNQQKLEEDLLTESKFLFFHKKYFAFLKYYFLLIFYSQNKWQILYTTLKKRIKKNKYENKKSNK